MNGEWQNPESGRAMPSLGSANRRALCASVGETRRAGGRGGGGVSGGRPALARADRVGGVESGGAGGGVETGDGAQYESSGDTGR